MTKVLPNEHHNIQVYDSKELENGHRFHCMMDHTSNCGIDPVRFKDPFHLVYWKGANARIEEIKAKKRLRHWKEKEVGPLNLNLHAALANTPCLLGNASYFAVFCHVRQTVSNRLPYILKILNLKELENSGDSPNNEAIASNLTGHRLPQTVSIGVKALCDIISDTKETNPDVCTKSLHAIRNMLQSYHPEIMRGEPYEVAIGLYSTLLDIAIDARTLSGHPDDGMHMTAAAAANLLGIGIGTGETQFLMGAITRLLTSPLELAEQQIFLPANQVLLQRAIQARVLGTSTRDYWIQRGVTNDILGSTFNILWTSDMKHLVGLQESHKISVKCLTSDGSYLYLLTSHGILKTGTGYNSTLKGHIYASRANIFTSEGDIWLLFCHDNLYIKIGRNCSNFYQIDKNTFEVKCTFSLNATNWQNSTLFSDMHYIGLITITSTETMSVFFFDASKISEGCAPLQPVKELSLQLTRRRTLVFGNPDFIQDDDLSKVLEPINSMSTLEIELDPVVSICMGSEFGLLKTANGKVFYTGRASALGLREPDPAKHYWSPLKGIDKRTKIKEIVIGHHGNHAILITESGAAMFTGLAPRGEDGDGKASRRPVRPLRLNKINKVEDKVIVSAACNYASTALVTNTGHLIIFGKDTQYCDENGIVTALTGQHIIKVAMGRAHIVTLNKRGNVCTFGFNNRGQCGRFSVKRDSESKTIPHLWKYTKAIICWHCRMCSDDADRCDSRKGGLATGEPCYCHRNGTICLNCHICVECGAFEDQKSCIGRVPKKINIHPSEASPPDPLQDDVTAGDFSHYTQEQKVFNNDHDGNADDDEEEQYQSSDQNQYDYGENNRVGFVNLPPARLKLNEKVAQISCGLQHTIMLTRSGKVMTFGMNNMGQLGVGDEEPHFGISTLKLPKGKSVAAGNNHSVILTEEGEVYTTGRIMSSMHKSERGDTPHQDWLPRKVAQLGAIYSCRARWIGASSNQTYIHIHQSIVKPQLLLTSSISASVDTIAVFSTKKDPAFKCLMINKNGGQCQAFCNAKQVDFSNTVTCMDPLYDVLWSYDKEKRVINCYNIMTRDRQYLNKCSDIDPGTDHFQFNPNNTDIGISEMVRWRLCIDVTNVELFETLAAEAMPKITRAEADTKIIRCIFHSDLAIPAVPGVAVTRFHAALNLLALVDALMYTTKCHFPTLRNEPPLSGHSPYNDFHIVERFEKCGGGWGYTSTSVEAIRFCCSTDINLGGIGLYGGRGDYKAIIRIFDLHTEGDDESDGELIIDIEEFSYKCSPNDKYTAIFEQFIPIMAKNWYLAWVQITGPSSECGSEGKSAVIKGDIMFNFKTSRKSNNGTDVHAGQIPLFLYTHVKERYPPSVEKKEAENICVLTKNFARVVTPSVFNSLTHMLQWTWNHYKLLLEQFQPLCQPSKLQKIISQMDKLVYIIRASLRLIKTYVADTFSTQPTTKKGIEYNVYAECLADIRGVLHNIQSDSIPGEQRNNGSVKWPIWHAERTGSIMQECHETVVTSFHAFYPTSAHKWNHFCSLLTYVKDGLIDTSYERQLISTTVALCSTSARRDILHYSMPAHQIDAAMQIISDPEPFVSDKNPSDSPDSDIAMKTQNCTTPKGKPSTTTKPLFWPSHSTSNQNPPLRRPKTKSLNHKDWRLLDVLPTLLEMVTLPAKKLLSPESTETPDDYNKEVMKYISRLLARIVSDLSHTIATKGHDSDKITGVSYMMTPHRFTRKSPVKSWNVGNGTPDAIGFEVDRSGISLIGVAVYGGLSHYQYEMELLQEVVNRFSDEESSHTWVGIDVAQGQFTTSDAYNDISHIKFDRPIHLKAHVQYAVRIRSQGGRTSNGDCGLSSVRGPDGTTFKFYTCSLSLNGTNRERGQIPYLIYFGSKPSAVVNAAPGSCVDTILLSIRNITIEMATTIANRCCDILIKLKNQCNKNNIKHILPKIESLACFSTLLPQTLTSLSTMSDASTCIRVLELVHKVLPLLTALQEDLPVPVIKNEDNVHYAWVESEHPYREASVTRQRVVFPPSVTWMVVEMDPRCGMAQPEDSLQIFAASIPSSRCHGHSGNGSKKKEREMDMPPLDLSYSLDTPSTCSDYKCNFVPVTEKMANFSSEWPQNALVIPGHEAIFSLETATDYLRDANNSANDTYRFGFKCLVTGYEKEQTVIESGLSTLENELVHAGGVCVKTLLSCNLEIPPPLHDMLPDEYKTEDEEDELLEKQDLELFLAQGLDIASLPTVQEALKGASLLRADSKERQFLGDFIAATPNTAGGRLADWLYPESTVDPSKCLVCPPKEIPRVGSVVVVTVQPHDQYGEAVTCPALEVELIVKPVESTDGRILHRVANLTPVSLGGLSVPKTEGHFEPLVKDKNVFQAITILKDYVAYSFEELRLTWMSSALGSGLLRIVPERMAMSVQPDGTYQGVWIPRAWGPYVVQLLVDKRETPQLSNLIVEEPSNADSMWGVTDPVSVDTPQQHAPKQHKLKRFKALHSAGLRVRLHPSLQSEQIGIVPVEHAIAYVEELLNNDGVWLRLDSESAHSFCDLRDLPGSVMTAILGGSPLEAWCLQYNQHTRTTLLFPLDTALKKDKETGLNRNYIRVATAHAATTSDHDECPSTSRLDLSSKQLDELYADVEVDDEDMASDQTAIFNEESDRKDGEELIDDGYEYADEECDSYEYDEFGDEAGQPMDIGIPEGRELQDIFLNEPENIEDTPNIGVKNEYDQYEAEEAQGSHHFREAYDMTYLQRMDKDENNGQEAYEREYEQQAEDEERYDPEDRVHHHIEENEEDPAEAVNAYNRKNGQAEEFEDQQGEQYEVNQEGEQDVENSEEEEEEYNEEMDRDADEDESQKCLEGKDLDLGFFEKIQPNVILDDVVSENGDADQETVQLIESAILYDWNSTSSINTSSNSTHPSSELPSLEDNVSVPKSESTMLLTAPIAEYFAGAKTAFKEKESRVCPVGHPIPFIKQDFNISRNSAGYPAKKTLSLNNRVKYTAERSEAYSQCDSASLPRHSGRGRRLPIVEIRNAFSRHEKNLPISKKSSRTPRLETILSTPESRFLEKDYAPFSEDSESSLKNVQPKQKKMSASPTQVHIVRTVFAALLWHEGIAHDAMACAAYLKFNRHLPKEGSCVVMRNNTGVWAASSQRHSLEASNAGNYLQIQPSALETLTRSALKASANRSRWKRFSELGGAITEENSTQPGPSKRVTSPLLQRITKIISDYMNPSTSTIVDVLPPAFRALASLWDCLCTIQEFGLTNISEELSQVEKVELDADASGPDQFKPTIENLEQERCVSPPSNRAKTLSSVWCELCGGASVQAPLAGHMRRKHPGCGVSCGRGYDRNGVYSDAAPVSSHVCGQCVHAFNLWYVMCSNCREKYIRELSRQATRAQHTHSSSVDPLPLNSFIKDNALFLLQLAPAVNSDALTGDNAEVTSPQFSPWLPSPPLNCLSAMGDQYLDHQHDRHIPTVPKKVLQSGITSINMINKDFDDGIRRRNRKDNNWLGNRFHRSVSLGPASRNVFSPECPHSSSQCDPMNSSIEGLGQPSSALQKLVGFDQNDTIRPLHAHKINVKDLKNRPVMLFVRAKRNLSLLRDTMDANVRISAIRKYALEAMNWMLRQSSRISSLHDIMWWFCVVLEQYRKDDHFSEDGGKIDYMATWGQGDRGSFVPASALSPAGRAGAGVRDALHAFLQSVSDAMPALPPNSASLLQAVRCWALRYEPSDHTFLHRSQVFSVINKILSRVEDDSEEEGAAAAPDSPNGGGLLSGPGDKREPYLLDCMDITSKVGITSSSRPAMIAALTDGSTESFWESSDENKKVPKFLSIDLPVPEPGQPKPHMICLHIDNSRDNAAIVNSITFLLRPYNVIPSSGTEIDADPKKGTWVCFSIPSAAVFPMFVRCELHGVPDGIVRVRQVKVLSEPVKKTTVNCSQHWTENPDQRVSPSNILREYIEIETLRVFRLITSQVFGKLINSESVNGELNTREKSIASTALETDETDLREHVVRILFDRSKMTNLQKKVMSHIVITIGAEARRARDFWENQLRVNPDHVDSPEDIIEHLEDEINDYRRQDNYCFEMLSLVLALSGSRTGRTHLAHQAELLPDLLCLLHTGSARVQRQVIALLRRIIGEVPPQKVKLAFAAGKEHSRCSTSLIDVLLMYIGKAISVQVKTRGDSQRGTYSARLATSVVCMTANMWFMRGYTSRKHAHLVILLLQHMAEDNMGADWGSDTRKALASYPARLTTVSEEHRNSDFSLSTPGLWLALGALCVFEEHFVDWKNLGVSSKNQRSSIQDGKQNRTLCTNHDDSETHAVMECSVCGTLCQECDRFLHLSRKNRSHPRKICKEEESSIRIDIHEGCGRAKLFWLLLLVDRRSLKAVVEFRCSTDVMTLNRWSGDGGSLPNPLVFTGICRFCGAQSDTGLLAIGNVCADQQCQAHWRESCTRVLACGHTCGGARGERVCLPCLHGCTAPPAEGSRPTLRQDADDMCMICFTDPISAAPAIQLTCGHVFHYLCCKKILENKWVGPRITFSFALCAICKDPIEHNILKELLDPIRQLEEEVKKKALMRLEYEDLMQAPAIAARYNNDPAAFAMDRYAYYVCFKCHKAYFGGEARCDAEAAWGGPFDPAELICGACSDVTGARICPKHSSDFLEYKCRYCCSVAVFFCFGTSHFCNACHDDFQRVTNMLESNLPHCPAGPKCTQLEGTSEDCPLRIAHPPTGVEFALGCGVCRNTHKF